MKAVSLALLAALLSVLAFPPYGPGVLIIPGITLFLVALRIVDTRRRGLWVGAVYGLGFYGGLMWWLANLELIALILVPVQAMYLAALGWWLPRFNREPPWRWLALAVGGWAILELIRYHFPVGGLEWGAVGYALSDSAITRLPAAAVGTTGLTVLVVMVAGVFAVALTRSWNGRLAWSAAVVVLAYVAAFPSMNAAPDFDVLRVAIVQGSTPCPFEHCPPNERLRTYQQHLDLTRTIEAGSVDLVVWPESSTGSTNADPVLNEHIGEEVAEQARRIGAAMLIGGDRHFSDTHWFNANVYFDADGEIVGEYRKQHPVPFGEYIPQRSWFDWIPALSRVPRDMIPGDSPVVFEGGLGSVISFEGGFSRYALGVRRAGATTIVVATNNDSYGPDAPTSDQFIGMTRMRAVELGVPIIHAAVSGRSTIVDRHGFFDGTTGFGTQEIFYGQAGESSPTLYTLTGDLIIYLAAIAGIIVWSRPLVGSGSGRQDQEV